MRASVVNIKNAQDILAQCQRQSHKGLDLFSGNKRGIFVGVSFFPLDVLDVFADDLSLCVNPRRQPLSLISPFIYLQFVTQTVGGDVN